MLQALDGAIISCRHAAADAFDCLRAAAAAMPICARSAFAIAYAAMILRQARKAITRLFFFYATDTVLCAAYGLPLTRHAYQVHDSLLLRHAVTIRRHFIR